MRLALALCLLAACTAGPAAPPADTATTATPAARRLPLSDFGTEPRVTVWPRVELVPENGLDFQVEVSEAVALDGTLAVWRIDGDEAIEVPEAVPRWRWNEERTIAKVAPSGLQRGAPYLLAGDGMTLASGVGLPTWGHRFRVMPADTDPPDARRVRVLGDPQPTTRNPLEIVFPEAMQPDCVRKIGVVTGGERAKGTFALSDDHLKVTFEPDAPWPEALVVVSLAAGIRDLGGNELANRTDEMIVPKVEVNIPLGPAPKLVPPTPGG